MAGLASRVVANTTTPFPLQPAGSRLAGLDTLGVQSCDLQVLMGLVE